MHLPLLFRAKIFINGDNRNISDVDSIGKTDFYIKIIFNVSRTFPSFYRLNEYTIV